MSLDLSSNLTDLRADGHSLRGYLTIIRDSQVVAEYTVDTTPTYPATSLAVTLTNGLSSNIVPNLEVEVTTSTGAFKGRLRVATGATISDTVLPVNEFSRGTVDVQSGDKLIVRNEFRIRNKLVASNADFDVDSRVKMTTQNYAPPPICNSGGLWAGEVDAGQTYATISFQGSTSFAVDPDSVSALTHNWQFGSDATPTSSTSANPSGVQIPAGFRHITHTVTDPDNGTSTIQYVPVYVHDAEGEFPAYDCLVQSLAGDDENGWSMTVRLFDVLDLDDLPDGCLVAFWVKEDINGTRQSFGSKVPGRSHIKFVGYLKNEQGEQEPGIERMTFEVQSVFTALRELFAFSRVMVESASPDAWSAIRGLTVKRAIIQLLRYYTTALDLYDLDFDQFGDQDYPRFYLQKQSVIDQIKDLASGRAARFVCDRRGRLMIQTIPQLFPQGSRNLITTQLTVAPDDLIRLRWRRRHNRQISTLEMRGFDASNDNAPIFSKWPGLAPADGPQYTVIERMIGDDQSWLNIIAGHRGAYLDQVYITEGGVFRQLSDLELEFFGSYDVFDFYAVWLKVNVQSDLRGLDFNDWRFTARSINVQYQDGTARVSVILRPETAGLPGVVYTPPSDNPLPSGTRPDPGYDDTGTPTGDPYIDDLAGQNKCQIQLLLQNCGTDNPQCINAQAPADNFDGDASANRSNALCHTVWQWVSNIAWRRLRYIQYNEGDPVTAMSGITAIFAPGTIMSCLVPQGLNDLASETPADMTTALQDADITALITCKMIAALEGQTISLANFTASLSSSAGLTTDENLYRRLIQLDMADEGNYAVFIQWLGLNYQRLTNGETLDCVDCSFDIVASAGANGSISPSGTTAVARGDDQTFTFTPDVDYEVDDVLVDGVSVGAVSSYTFTDVTADHTISVSFVSTLSLTITASAGANGSISPSGAVSVNSGNDQSFSITPSAGYLIDDVLVDGVSVGPVSSYTFTNVTTNHTISVSFAVTIYDWAKTFVFSIDEQGWSAINASLGNEAIYQNNQWEDVYPGGSDERRVGILNIWGTSTTLRKATIRYSATLSASGGDKVYFGGFDSGATKEGSHVVNIWTGNVSATGVNIRVFPTVPADPSGGDAAILEVVLEGDGTEPTWPT